VTDGKDELTAESVAGLLDQMTPGEMREQARVLRERATGHDMVKLARILVFIADQREANPA
jgi:hypothetical protein